MAVARPIDVNLRHEFGNSAYLALKQCQVRKIGRLDLKRVHEPEPLRRLDILIVDSDLNECRKLQHSLDSEFTVTCIHSLETAVSYLETHTPDLVISEVMLNHEQQGGLALCHTIRSMLSLQNLPIMLLTSMKTLADKVAGFDAGADDYVVKPCDARQLAARIRLLARIKRLEQHHKRS